MAGTTLLTYGTSVDSLLSTTLSAIQPTLADTIFTRIPTFMWLYQKNKIKRAGGASLLVPLLNARNSTAAAYSGYGIINTTAQEGMVAAQYAWKQYAVSVTISGLEEMQNQGQEAVIKLLEAKVEQAEKSLRDQLDIDLWAATQVSNGIQSLPVLVATTGTVADIARSGNTWWQAQVTASGSFAARGQADMRALYNTIVNQSTDNGTPDFCIAAQAVYEFYEGSLQPQQRFSDDKMASAGFENLKYKACTMTFGGNVPSGNLFMLKSDDLKLYVHSQRDFVTSPFVKPSNQDARVAQILFMGNIVSDNPRKQGKLTGVTA